MRHTHSGPQQMEKWNTPYFPEMAQQHYEEINALKYEMDGMK